jgi:hypothetical protein
LKRLLVAFCAAPVLPAIVKTWLVSGPGELISLTVLWWIAGFLYTVQLVVGLPGLLFLRHYGQSGFGAYLVLGFLTVALPAIFASLHWCALKGCLADSFMHSAYLGVFGVPMGAIFWLIARPDRQALHR